VVFDRFRSKQFRLLYRGSRDGFRAKDFHRLCDGQANTLALISDTNGNQFGFFVPMPWYSGDLALHMHEDSECFLFTFKHPDKILDRRLPDDFGAMKKAVLMSSLVDRVIGFLLGPIAVLDQIVRKVNDVEQAAVNYRAIFAQARRQGWSSDAEIDAALTQLWDLANDFGVRTLDPSGTLPEIVVTFFACPRPPKQLDARRSAPAIRSSVFAPTKPKLPSESYVYCLKPPRGWFQMVILRSHRWDLPRAPFCL
jgi:hypothetical protein